MKKFYKFMLLMQIPAMSFAQSISPSINSEYCPETEITFTVTIPGAYQTIVGSGGSYVTVSPYNFSTSGGNVIFNFKGKFGDQNNAQSFNVGYLGGGTTSTVQTHQIVCLRGILCSNTTKPKCNNRCTMSSSKHFN